MANKDADRRTFMKAATAGSLLPIVSRVLPCLRG